MKGSRGKSITIRNLTAQTGDASKRTNIGIRFRSNQRERVMEAL